MVQACRGGAAAEEYWGGGSGDQRDNPAGLGGTKSRKSHPRPSVGNCRRRSPVSFCQAGGTGLKLGITSAAQVPPWLHTPFCSSSQTGGQEGSSDVLGQWDAEEQQGEQPKEPDEQQECQHAARLEQEEQAEQEEHLRHPLHCGGRQ